MALPTWKEVQYFGHEICILHDHAVEQNGKEWRRIQKEIKDLQNKLDDWESIHFEKEVKENNHLS